MSEQQSHAHLTASWELKSNLWSPVARCQVRPLEYTLVSLDAIWEQSGQLVAPPESSSAITPDELPLLRSSALALTMVDYTQLNSGSAVRRGRYLYGNPGLGIREASG